MNRRFFLKCIPSVTAIPLFCRQRNDISFSTGNHINQILLRMKSCTGIEFAQNLNVSVNLMDNTAVVSFQSIGLSTDELNAILNGWKECNFPILIEYRHGSRCYLEMFDYEIGKTTWFIDGLPCIKDISCYCKISSALTV